MENSINSIRFISVESRKGGVGKTTISLALSQLLLSRGYHVLLLDLDLSGTRLGDSFIKEHTDFLHAVEFEGKNLNIVDLYKRVFLSGQGVPRYEDLGVDEKRCNYISSDIYSGGDSQPIEDPRVLLDSLHAFWMKKLVLNLSSTFGDYVRKRGGRGVVILDNGPGYSSLETTIHEMMTTLGPEQAKFLLVSSVDDQDWGAIKQSAEIVSKMLQEKMLGGDYYRALVNNKNFQRLDSPYFDEVWKELCLTNGMEPEYYSKERDVPAPSHYLCRIINKAPYEKTLQSSITGDDVMFVPIIPSLQYLFSSLIVNESSKLVFGEKPLSMKVQYIIEDDKEYNKCVEGLKEIGIPFLQSEWAPLYPFNRLYNYYVGQEIPVKPVARSLQDALRSKEVDKSSKEDYECNLVKRFLKVMTQDKESAVIVDEASYLLGRAGESLPVDLHTEKESLRHLSEPIMLAGEAIYYLKNYSSICQLLTSVIYSVKNPDVYRKLDVQKLSGMVDDALAGHRRMDSSFLDEFKEVLSTQVSMREMKERIDVILKQWGI